MKLADKICNLRDLAHNPPTDWTWRAGASTSTGPSAVIAGLRGTHPGLEALFDAACAARP